nr:hypothetical protein [Pedobacter lusitanus]
MAAICEIKQSMISYIEGGKRDLPTNAIQNLFLKKNISPTYLLTGGDNMEFNKPTDTQISGKIKNMEADIEILKAEIERLKTPVLK